jgi:acetoin utilization deacetylase AcuC-like enzyme
MAQQLPFHKEHSDLDLALPDGSDDQAFLEAVQSGLPRALAEARADLVIFIAGADPYKEDRLGRLSMTKAGLAERDRMVFENCRAKGLPVAVVMGGGYARDVNDVVDIHFQTFSLQRIWRSARRK